MAQIGNNENAFYENTIALTREITMAAKRALYWTDDPEVMSQLAMVLSAAERIRKGVIERSEERHAEAAALNGKVTKVNQ